MITLDTQINSSIQDIEKYQRRLKRPNLSQKHRLTILSKLDRAEKDLNRLMNLVERASTNSNSVINKPVKVIINKPALSQPIIQNPKVDWVAPRVEKAVKNILKVNSTSLPKDQISRVCNFMEKTFQSLIAEGTFYLTKEKTGLTCNLEYDPETKLHFIHTNDFVGEGISKFVTKSIQYDVEHPLMLANGYFATSGMQNTEIELHKKLSHVNRVVRLIAAPLHMQGKTLIQEVITKLYPLGSLENFHDMDYLSIKEKVCFAKDLMEALKGLHALKIAYNDLHAGNVLLELNEDPNLKGINYRLVLMDFGRASHGYFENFSLDITRAAILLHVLFYYTDFSLEESYQRKRIIDQHEVISPAEKLELILITMTHQEYKHKCDAAYWYYELDTLLSKL